MSQDPRPQTSKSGALYDEWLVTLAQRGDRKAFERLHARWAPRVLRTARRYTDDADLAFDLAQDCWAGVWKGLRGLKTPSQFRSYLFAVLYRRGSHYIKRSVAARSSHADLTDKMPATSSVPGERLAILQAFAQLSPDQRMAAHLHFVEGLTLIEIAAVQAIPEGTAKSRIFHARRTLKQALDPQSENGENNGRY